MFGRRFKIWANRFQDLPHFQQLHFALDSAETAQHGNTGTGRNTNASRANWHNVVFSQTPGSVEQKQQNAGSAGPTDNTGNTVPAAVLTESLVQPHVGGSRAPATLTEA